MGFQQGLSGLGVSAKSLEVIGNNVANANTYGQKASRAEFADVYANVNGGGSNAVGIGAQVGAVAQQFTQGNITTTDNPMDLAVNGAGFFQVGDGENPALYTRNGQFKIDRNGFIVNNKGDMLLGYRATNQGLIIPSKATPIQLPTGGVDPNPTSTIGMEMNLDSRSVVPTAAFNPTNPASYNSVTSQTVYDSKGQGVSLTYYFRRIADDTLTGDNQWEVHVNANNAPIAGADPMPTTLLFNFTTGRLTSPLTPLTLDIPQDTTQAPPAYEAITGISVDFTTATQFGSVFGVTNLNQDGYARGELSSIVVDATGVLQARYSNGKTQAAGQIELANFRNPQGLQALGNNEWSTSFSSGDPIVGVPSSGNFGVLQSGALEESNVDLTGELVNMIVAQRAYQANAQTIKTEDQVLQTLVNLR